MPSALYGRGFGTSGYIGVAEVQPNVVLLAYDQLPVGKVGTAGPQQVYSMRVNLTRVAAP